MHGMTGKPPGAAADKSLATSRVMLLLLVCMTGVAPISLYMLVPALPVLATTFERDISVAQMTVSLYMVGIALSQLISNVPAAILLAEHSQDARVIAYAVDVGGFGFAVGSLANLIALRMLPMRHAWPAFHVYSVPFLAGAGTLTYLWLFER